MKPGINAYRLIKMFEGLSLKAYRCPAGIPTVGYGNTRYPNGKAVRMGETITKEQADSMLEYTVREFAEGVDKLVGKVSQNQFDALVSFAFNVGLGNFGKSTLLRKVNANPNDPSIRDEFLRWNKAAGKVLAGLTRRRGVEAGLYFKAEL